MRYINNITDIRQPPRGRAEIHILPLRDSAAKKIVQAMLNEVLATELVCVLRYRRYYFMTHELLAGGIKHRFLTYAKVDQEHADRLAERIVQLGGSPHFDPSDLAVRSHWKYTAGRTLHDMVGEDLFVRTAIESYTNMLSYLKGQDPTTVRMLDWILDGQKEHAEDMSGLFNSLPEVLSL
jgi:bacterioferritin